MRKKRETLDNNQNVEVNIYISVSRRTVHHHEQQIITNKQKIELPYLLFIS